MSKNLKLYGERILRIHRDAVIGKRVLYTNIQKIADKTDDADMGISFGIVFGAQ